LHQLVIVPQNLLCIDSPRRSRICYEIRKTWLTLVIKLEAIAVLVDFKEMQVSLCYISHKNIICIFLPKLIRIKKFYICNSERFYPAKYGVIILGSAKLSSETPALDIGPMTAFQPLLNPGSTMLISS
jgi:hypothetical protein